MHDLRSAAGPALRPLQAAWTRSDLLLSILREEAWLAQPIRLRQPFLFYLGHLPAFAWNHLGRGVLAQPSFAPELDALFERGIDPVGVDSYQPAASWPALERVIEYRDRVRRKLCAASELHDPERRGDRDAAAALQMVIEHELMHHETLLYMLQELEHSLKRRPESWPALPPRRAAEKQQSVAVEQGEAVLGAARGSLLFGWDNEFPEQRVPVEAFIIDRRPATNGDWLEFVADGGYHDSRWWREADWAWLKRQALALPHSWRGLDDEPLDEGRLRQARVRSLLEDVPFETAESWPVVVSWAEANAYARWRGARLPTEAEWHRAAYGSPDERTAGHWPWGDAPPATEHANIGFQLASPAPAGAFGAGASARGVLDLLGNGWEWTGSPFAPFPGFTPMPRYPGYSADFFDGEHFVLLGGSWATDAALLRRSFRNWFQPHYPYVFSKLRCVRRLR